MGHVLLISLFYGNLFQQRKRAIHSIYGRYPLIFTAPLTMWQGLYSSLFYAKKRRKILDRFLFERTDGLELPASYLVTGVQSREVVKKEKR